MTLKANPVTLTPYGQAPMGLEGSGAFGARVLSFVCYTPNDGFGPQSGLVQRGVLYAAARGSENRPAGLLSGGAPIGGQDRDGASYRYSAPYTLSRFAGLPLKGKREI